MPLKTRRTSKTRTRNGKAAQPFRLPLTVSRAALIHAGSDERFRQLIYDLSILASHLDTARKFLAKRIGLTPPQYNIVMVVAQYQGEIGVSVGSVADHLHVSPAFVAAECTRLVHKRFLVKAPNPDDGRSVLLRLSDTAERRIESIAPLLVELNDEFFASLDQRDFADLSRIVAQMVNDSARALSLLHLEERLDGKRVVEAPLARRLQRLRARVAVA